jgi:hypothetical protein
MDRSKNRNRKQNKARPQGGPARSIERAGDQLVKRMTLSANTLATGAGTVIPVTALSSAQVQSNPAAEWASFASRYQQYRVRSIRVRGKAINPVNTTTPLVHSVLFRADFIGNATPATAAQVLSDENARECATHTSFEDVVTWVRNPNAKLWNPTTAAIPVANTFSWVCASPPAPVLTGTTTYYALVYEWEVEFRGSQ